MNPRIRIGAALAAACVIAACAATPEPRYYVLQGPTASAAVRDSVHEASLVVEPVAIPTALDRPQMVLTRGPGEVAIDDAHRWAAPLQAGITEALARDLAALRARPVRIDDGADPGMGDRIAVRIVAFDSRLGESATIEASWEVRRGDRAQAGSATVREAAPGGHESLVQAHSRALERVAHEIGASVVALDEAAQGKTVNLVQRKEKYAP